MTKKIKLIFLAIFVTFLASLGVYLYYNISSSKYLTTALPKPSEEKPYILLEATVKDFPTKIVEILTEKSYEIIKSGTSQEFLVKVASTAEKSAFLIEHNNDGFLQTYVAAEFSHKETKMLHKGTVPQSIKDKYPNITVKQGEPHSTWILSNPQTGEELYYYIEGKRILLATNKEDLEILKSTAKGQTPSAGRNKWKKDSSWQNNIEISDGGIILSRYELTSPIKVRASWRELPALTHGEPIGEAKWEIVENKEVKLYKLLSTLKPIKWDNKKCLAPDPTVITIGMNVPQLPEDYNKWPFPLSILGKFVESLELSPKEASKAISGKTIFAVGGINKMLWLTLPGFMVEFSGQEEEMRMLVSSFWDKIFFGAEPTPLQGFSYGGMAQLPFSTIGAGNGTISVFGLIGEKNITQHRLLDNFLKKDEEVIGWLTADMDKVAASLLHLAKLNSFSSGSETQSVFDSETPVTEEDVLSPEPFQPEMAMTPFDSLITPSLCEKIAKLGKIVLVWENSTSGRINWYNQQ
ncbi:MAG: hypothetical protein RR272_04110 [Synergistaceae bacterium]